MRNSFFKPVFEKLPIDTFAPNVLISGWAISQKARIKLFEVSFKNREFGTASLRKFKLLKSVLKSFYQTLLFRIKLFFGYFINA